MVIRLIHAVLELGTKKSISLIKDLKTARFPSVKLFNTDSWALPSPTISR